jgi:hypothetical protein
VVDVRPPPRPVAMSAPAAARPLAGRALAPIRQALAGMGAHPGQAALNGISPDLTAPRPDDDWVPATALTSGSQVDEMLRAAQDHWHAKPHVAAALAFKAYSYWLALPAVIGFAAARRVPLLRPDRVLVNWAPRPRFMVLGLAEVDVAVLASDPLAVGDRTGLAEAGIRVVPDDDALLTELRLSLMDEHLALVVEQLRDRVRLGSHTMWGSLAAGVAVGLSRGADVVAGSTLDTANYVLAGLGLSDLVDIAPTAGGLDVQRKTCCLAFKLPQPRYCTGCCIS